MVEVGAGPHSSAGPLRVYPPRMLRRPLSSIAPMMALRIATSVAIAATFFSGCRRPSSQFELHGVVTNAAGVPVGGAVVVANRPREAMGRHIVTKPDGSFDLTLEKGSPFALTATSDVGTATYRSPESFHDATPRPTLVLGDANQGFLV